MATRRRSSATHAHRMGPEGAGRRASSRSNRGGPAPARRRRRRGASRPHLVRSAAVLAVVAAAVILVSGQLGTWDALLQPQQVADRQPLATSPATGGGASAGGPVVWSTGRDLAERSEGVRREGRPIAPIELTGYQWPLANAEVANGYGPTKAGSFSIDGGRFNDGLDLETSCGDPVVAAHAGIVIAEGRRYDEALGWLGDLAPYFERLDRQSAWKDVPIGVVVDDGNGYRSIYAHFKETVVTVGQRVLAGELLGYEGKSGGAPRCRLHYAIFSPHETATMKLVRRVAERTLLPNRAIARIDPLAVLPAPEARDISPD